MPAPSSRRALRVSPGRTTGPELFLCCPLLAASRRPPEKAVRRSSLARTCAEDAPLHPRSLPTPSPASACPHPDGRGRGRRWAGCDPVSLSAPARLPERRRWRPPRSSALGLQGCRWAWRPAPWLHGLCPGHSARPRGIPTCGSDRLPLAVSLPHLGRHLLSLAGSRQRPTQRQEGNTQARLRAHPALPGSHRSRASQGPSGHPVTFATN